MEKDDITLLLIAHNARFRIASRLTTKHKTGYQIRPECDLFGRKKIPEDAVEFLARQGLPAQNRYTQIPHLNRLLRLLKPFLYFTKDPQGLRTVTKHIGSLPTLNNHEDVGKILEVLEDAI